jgi:hypothetical protein
MASDPYVRVFRRIIDDPRFDGVYDHDRTLATWLRLRIEADANWPASTALPYGANKAAIKRLDTRGLITLLANGRFRMPDIDEDRTERSDTGRTAANARWASADAPDPDMHPHSDGNASGVPTSAEQPSPTQGRPTQARADLSGVAEVEPPITPTQLSREHRLTTGPDDSWSQGTQVNGGADHGSATTRRFSR